MYAHVLACTRKINVSCGLRVALRHKCKGYHSSITATALAGSQYFE